MPPFGGILYYLRHKTIKVPYFKKLSDSRNFFDISLYLAFIYFLLKLCFATAITPQIVLPIVIILPLLGLFDIQLFLGARGDVWYPALFVFIFPDEIKAGLTLCWFGVWFWAAFSKLTPSFPSVVIVKTSPDLRKQLGMYYDAKTSMSILSRFISFRLMHVPGRVLVDLIPKAVKNFNDYYWLDGEIMAGEVVGWNFGEGHLHSEKLLKQEVLRVNILAGLIVMFQTVIRKI